MHKPTQWDIPSDQREELLERLLAKIKIVGDCWEWTGPFVSVGYGMFYIGAKAKPRQRMAHRAAYELLVGPIPEGCVVDHLCRNRRCIRPEHLEPVGPGTNVLRGIGVTAMNALKSHCKSGHPYNQENTTKKSDGGRRCKACEREYCRRYRERKKAAATSQPAQKLAAGRMSAREELFGVRPL